MDTTTLDYALMAGEAYFDKRRPKNAIPMPVGATLLGGGLGGRALSSGYEARAYDYNGKIVISFAGTYFPDKFLGGLSSGSVSANDAASLKDFGANINLFVGTSSLQLRDAASYYQDIKRANPGKEITFTGHSLGGGLAALMGVFFDKQAITFDPAPFRSAATEANALLLRLFLAVSGFPADADLNGFTASQAPLGTRYPEVLAGLLAAAALGGPLTQAAATLLALYPVPYTIRGESNVRNVAVAGEFLTGNNFSDFRNQLRIGTGGNELVAHGSLGLLGGTDAHSISLLYLLGKSSTFQQVTSQLPNLLPSIFDPLLYLNPVDKPEANFVEVLLREETGASGVQSTSLSTGYLDKFVADLRRLTGADGMTSQTAVQQALVVAAMDYYYFKTHAEASQFFGAATGGVHFNYADIGQPQTGLKSPRLLADAIKPFLSAAEWSAAGYKLETQGARHIQSGDAGMTWTASSAAYDAAIGGTGTDVFDGGVGDDILIGGAGADFLNGGADKDILIGGLALDYLDGGTGDDRLMGGDGADVYNFSGLWGADTIEDSGGDGVLQVAGLGNLDGTGAKKIGEGSWKTDDGKVRYTQVNLGTAAAPRYDLIITVSNGGTAGTVTLRNWVPGQLGITLDPTLIAPVTSNSFSGDVAKQMNGTQYVLDGQHNYVSDGPMANTQDNILGTLGADHLQGLGGNDFLFGGDGDDLIEGGAGDDLISGAHGADRIFGGDGNDYIFGSSSSLPDINGRLLGTQPTPLGPVLTQRFSWVVTDNGLDANGYNAKTINGPLWFPFASDDTIGTGTGNYVVDGGAGDDFVSGMAGEDFLRGGEGNDQPWRDAAARRLNGRCGVISRTRSSPRSANDQFRSAA